MIVSLPTVLACLFFAIYRAVALPTLVEYDTFIGCTDQERDIIEAARFDAMDLASDAIYAFHQVERFKANNHDDGKYVGDEYARDMIVRWFGKSATPDQWPSDDAGYIIDVYERMYKMLEYDKGTFRCLRSCAWVVPPGTRVFAGPPAINMDEGVIYSKPEWDGINFCPSFFQDAMHFNQPPKEAYDERAWYDKFEHDRRPTEETWAVYENFNPMVKMLMAAMAKLPEIGKSKQIHDLCLPGVYNETVYGALSPQILARYDEALAIHSAINYAGFAIEVTLTGIDSPPPEPPADFPSFEGFEFNPELVDKSPWPKPFQKVREMKAMLEDIDKFETVEGTWDGYRNETGMGLFKCV